VALRVDDDNQCEPPVIDHYISAQRRYGKHISRQAIAPSHQHTPCSRGRFSVHCGAGYQLRHFGGLKASPGTKPAVANIQPILEPQNRSGGLIHFDDLAAAVGNDHSRAELIERSQRDGIFPSSVMEARFQPINGLP
jgi:hypothetical protein